MERLFDLDFQLLHDAILTAVSVFFLFMFLSYLLFDPVHEMLKKRREKIQNDIDSAKKDLETAKTRKEVYEVIGEFVADVAKVKTSNEKKLEEALRAAEEAKQKYNNSNNNQGTELPFSTEQPADNTNNTDNSNNANNTDNSGNYKSNDLTNGQDQEEDNGGFLNSLIGGMTSGASGN